MGEVAAFDSETGEELTMISADGVVDDAVYDKIFSEEFFKWFQDIHMKKEILIQKIKKLRGDAKKAGKNITETVQTRNSDGAVHEKVFTFLADGTVIWKRKTKQFLPEEALDSMKKSTRRSSTRSSLRT